MNRNLVIGAAALLAVAGLGYYQWNTTTTDRSGEPLVAVTVPELSPIAREGEAIYNANCASCHGKNAAGQEGVAPPFVHKLYEPNHHADIAFLLAAQQGVRAHHWPFGNMPPIEGVTEQEVARIVAYVRELQKANGIF